MLQRVEPAAEAHGGQQEEVASTFYNDADKSRFESFFITKRKRGRPPKKKKKRGRPRKKSVTANSKKKQRMCDVDLTSKAADNLDHRLEAAVQASRAAIPKSSVRINWDREPHYSLRKRVADSWILKKDLWIKSETLRKFCDRMHVSRPVLCRYLPKRKQEL